LLKGYVVGVHSVGSLHTHRGGHFCHFCIAESAC
jgi:hypothetical protein